MSKPKSKETIESQPLPDGSALLFDPATATAYPITESAMRIWQLCDGQHDVASIVDDLEARYDVERQALERDSLQFLAEMEEKQLLVEPAAGA
jgi:hypothetical protein